MRLGVRGSRLLTMRGDGWMGLWGFWRFWMLMERVGRSGTSLFSSSSLNYEFEHSSSPFLSYIPSSASLAPLPTPLPTPRTRYFHLNLTLAFFPPHSCAHRRGENIDDGHLRLGHQNGRECLHSTRVGRACRSKWGGCMCGGWCMR
jgi:hypothetical protein